MNLEQLTENFKQLNKEIEKAMAQMKSDSRSLVKRAAQELFQAAPEIDFVFWTQYTPYFNDGEPCSFSVNGIYYVLVGEEEDCEGSYLYTQEDRDNALKTLQTVTEYTKDPAAWLNKLKIERNLSDHANLALYKPWPYTIQAAQSEVDKIETQRLKYPSGDVTRISNAFNAFYTCMQMVPDEIMQSVFGDHVRVIISRNGLETEDYGHE
jgi:hypothetical protein